MTMDNPNNEMGDGKPEVSLRRKLLGGGVSMLASRLAMLFGGLATFLYLSRALGPASYGVYGLTVVIGQWVTSIAYIISGGAKVQILAGHRNGERFAPTALRLSLLTGLVLGSLLFISSPWLAKGFQAPGLVSPLRIVALDVPLQVVSNCYLDILLARNRYNDNAALTVGYWISRALFSCLLVSLGAGVLGASASLALASFLLVVVGHSMCRVGLWNRDAFPMMELMSLGRKRTVQAFASKFLLNLDLFAVQWWLGSAQATGLYAAAKNLAMVALSVFSSSLPVISSTLAGMHGKGDRELGGRLEKKYMSALVYLCGFLSSMGSIAIPAMGVLLGSSYNDSGPIAIALVMGAAFYLLGNGPLVVMASRGERGSMAVALSVLTLLSVAMYRWLPDALPRLPDGSVYAWIFTLIMFTFAALSFRTMGVLIGVRTPWRSVAAAALSAGLATTLGLWLDGRVFPVADVWTLTLQTLAVATAYLSVLWILDGKFFETLSHQSPR